MSKTNLPFELSLLLKYKYVNLDGSLSGKNETKWNSLISGDWIFVNDPFTHLTKRKMAEKLPIPFGEFGHFSFPVIGQRGKKTSEQLPIVQ